MTQESLSGAVASGNCTAYSCKDAASAGCGKRRVRHPAALIVPQDALRVSPTTTPAKRAASSPAFTISAAFAPPIRCAHTLSWPLFTRPSPEQSAAGGPCNSSWTPKSTACLAWVVARIVGAGCSDPRSACSPSSGADSLPTFRLRHACQQLSRRLLPTSGNSDCDSRRDERSIGTWPPLCYVATCEVGPTWNWIAYAENFIANLSASCPQPIRIPASPTSGIPSDVTAVKVKLSR